jgi:NADH-quinone oxidoreductase subunit M
MLWLYQRTVNGKLDNPANEKLHDISLREVLTLLPLVVASFWIGLYPKPVFDVLREPVERLVRQVDGSYEYPETANRLRPHPVDGPARAEAVASSGSVAAGR